MSSTHMSERRCKLVNSVLSLNKMCVCELSLYVSQKKNGNLLLTAWNVVNEYL